MVTATTKDNAANDLKQNARNVKNEATDALHTATAAAQNVAYDLGKNIHEFADTAGTELRNATETLRTQITDKPVQSTLVGLALGFVLGALFRR